QVEPVPLGDDRGLRRDGGLGVEQLARDPLGTPLLVALARVAHGVPSSAPSDSGSGRPITAVTLPNPPRVEAMLSPGASGKALVNDPGRTTCPASSRTPSGPIVLASQTRLLIGDPSTAPPAP